MNCPSCDGVMNAVRCNGCGWQVKDDFPHKRLVQNSENPLKAHLKYPPIPEHQRVLVNAMPMSRGQIEARGVTITLADGRDIVGGIFVEPEEVPAAVPVPAADLKVMESGTGEDLGAIPEPITDKVQ